MDIGQRFGLLTVLVFEGGRRRYTLCRCACGTEKRVRLDHLKAGKTVSCGCERSRLSSERSATLHRANIKHGMSGTRAHNIWFAMRQRCGNPKNKAFPYYGGRGIMVCPEWEASFEAFLRDMGEPPEGGEIDRIDSNGNYEPSNCRWSTRREQQNNRRVNRVVAYNGITQTVAEWSRQTGIHRNTLDKRLSMGWPLDRVFNPDKQPDLAGLALGVAARAAKRKDAP